MFLPPSHSIDSRHVTRCDHSCVEEILVESTSISSVSLWNGSDADDDVGVALVMNGEFQEEMKSSSNRRANVSCWCKPGDKTLFNVYN